MKYNPDIHHRRSIRLRDYDYSANGAYFVTVCVQGRESLFGAVVDGVMESSEAGRMVEEWWAKLAENSPNVLTDSFVVMPNHFHGIIVLVGADPCVCPDLENAHMGKGGHMGPPLQRIIQWLKTMTTNAYIRGVKQSDWPSFPGRLWQRNYYERIIRDEEELIAIREYIAGNPAKWAQDKENPMNVL
ncbi:MAG: hypothetical protein HYS23_07100 [Geobacter sp.]|nr:hypothetical protein [Geobacter sp.]